MNEDLQPYLGHASPRDLIGAAVGTEARLFREEGVELVSFADPAAPAIRADPQRVALVLLCLLRNARAHTPQGGKVDVRAEPAEGRVRFTVTDTGDGLPAEYRGRAFEPFFQVPGTENLGDVGLGLAVSRRIVEESGGEIHLESKEGRGTTVWFTLPAVEG